MDAAQLIAGTGESRIQDSFEAGRAAASDALASLGGQPPALVMVFTTPRHQLDRLLAGVRSRTGSTLLVGATTSGEIVRGTYLGFGAGVAVLAMTAGPYRFGAASRDHIRGDLGRAARELVAESRERAGRSAHAAVLLMADAMAGDLQELVQGVYRAAGPKVSLVGGAAGDELKFVRCLVLHDDRVVEEGAVAVWIAAEQPLRVVTRHGWEPVGKGMHVTRAAGTTIEELDGRPAATVYEEQLGLAGRPIPPDRFWGTSILHPFGLMQDDGTSVIRVARSKTDRGELRIQGCLPPPGCEVRVMNGSVDSLLEVVGEVGGACLGSRRNAGVLLAFSCAARAAILGARAPEEARRLQDSAGEVPTFGFYCCGEFARTAGILGTHNATLTAIAL
jgi:hypothetical protein